MTPAEAIHQRSAVRAFLDRPVDDALIKTVLETARWAPSGVNTQPWDVAVVRGDHKKALTEALIQAREQGLDASPDYGYYPTSWEEPYLSRRRECGLRLYQALGIEKNDTQGKMASWANNYRFFGAPVGLFFFIDKRLNTGSWLDMGMFLQNIMIAAVGEGLATCPQASVADYPDIVREILHIPSDRLLICGMSLGYADMRNPVNQYRLPRLSTDEFTRWYD